MLKKLSFALAAILSVSLLASCIINTSDDGDDEPKSGSVDYTSYKSNAALIVKNNTSKNMVIFKGEPTAKSILGGVKAGDTNYLKKNPEVFNVTSDFIVYVVTEEDFDKYYETQPEVLSSSPYTTFYAVYNIDSTNEYVYQISNSLFGKYKLILNNGTNYNIELREKSPDYGTSLAFALSMTFEKSYKMTEGEYMIFPVFRKYDKVSGEIISTYPTYKTGTLAGQAKSYEFSLDQDTTERQFNAVNWVKDINFTPSATYIKIINSADQGLQFFTSANSTPVMTQAGGKRINDGKSLTFAITMDKLTNSTYEEEKVVAGYRVATNRIDDIYLNGSASTTVTYKAGYMYTYTVSGDPENGYVVTPLTESDGTTLKAQEVDFSKL